VRKKTEKVAWAYFVLELRRCGFIGDPEKYRGFFESYFDSYFHENEDICLRRSFSWYVEHCCDCFDLDDFDEEDRGRIAMEWTEEDRLDWFREFAKNKFIDVK